MFSVSFCLNEALISSVDLPVQTLFALFGVSLLVEMTEARIKCSSLSCLMIFTITQMSLANLDGLCHIQVVFAMSYTDDAYPSKLFR